MFCILVRDGFVKIGHQHLKLSQNYQKNKSSPTSVTNINVALDILLEKVKNLLGGHVDFRSFKTDLVGWHFNRNFVYAVEIVSDFHFIVTKVSGTAQKSH